MYTYSVRLENSCKARLDIVLEYSCTDTVRLEYSCKARLDIVLEYS